MRKILPLLFLVISVQVFAQTYPITSITISLPANPDANTANWGTGAGIFTITANSKLLNGRLDGRVQESKILVTIKKSGGKICGTYTSNSAPAANFNSVNKVWSGSNAVSLLGQGCVLPAGDYEMCVQFFGAGPAGIAPISEEKTKPFSIRAKEQLSYQPPQAIAPANGTVLSETDIKKPITFRWTPVVPRPQEQVTYRVKVWQLMQGQNGVQAMKVNQPIITKDVDNLTQTIINNLISGPCLAPYLCDYIWNVQALNREGKPVGGNNGMSEALKINVHSVNDAPIIDLVFPANGSTVSTKDKPKFTWTHEKQDTESSSTYKIKIVEIIGDQSPEVALRTNKPHFEKDSLKEISFQYPLSAPSFIAGKKYGWNVSIFDRWGKLQPSAASMFFASSCDVNLILKLQSVECLPDSGKHQRYKIGVSATYTSAVHNLTYALSGSGLKAYHPSYTPNYSIANISPGLQVQNSGLTTTKTYFFEVSVLSGQTAIKVGMQGDDKDPGPIVCQPGAELDVQLPICDVGCKCGTWNPLTVQTAAGAKRYDCGSRILWSCKIPFEFTSSYQCNPNTDNCKAKVKWTITKDGSPYTAGTGAIGAFTPTANGTYKITLDADCNGIQCPSCTYTIVVTNCIDNTCDCGTWNPLTVQTAAGAKRYDCGSRILWSCKTPFQFTSTYQCSPTDKTCEAKTTWEVRKGETLIKSGTGTNQLNDGFSLLENGTYTLTLNAECNGKKCPPCIYTIVVEDCKVADPCKDVLLCNTDFEQFVNISNPTTFVQTSQDNIACWKTTALDSKIEIWKSGFGGVPAYSGNYFAELNATQVGTLYQTFTATGPITVSVSFAHRGRYAGDDKMQALIVSPGGISTLLGNYSANNTGWLTNVTPPYTIPSTALGIYTLQFKTVSSNNGAGPSNGGNFLDAITVTCTEAPPVDVCDCGTWNPLTVQTAAGAKRYDCGSTIKWSCKAPFKFTSSYQCNPNDDNCRAKTTWEIKKGDVLIKAGTGTNNISDVVSLIANGTYTLILNANCNEIKCKPCTYIIIVEDCKEEKACECGKWEPINVDNGIGNLLRYDCGKDIEWNCKRPFTFGSTFVCNPSNENCYAKTSWTITKDGGNYSSGTGSEGTFNPIENGVYTLTLNVECGGKKCPPCVYRIIVKDCIDTACSCGKWGPLLIKNAASSVQYECGKEIPWKCKLPFNFSSSYQCDPGTDQCKAKVKWTITKDGNPYTSGTGTTGAFTPTANGRYTITFDAECTGIKCRPCTYTIIVGDCDKKCDCGIWGTLVVDNKKVDCGSKILWNCKLPFQFTTAYLCNPNDEGCQARTTWEIKKGDVIIKTGTGTNNLSDGFDFTADGTYTLTLNATCNGIKCQPCTYTIVVEDCDKKVEPIQSTVLKYYYDLDKDPTYPYSEISNKTLNVQFVNNYASIVSIQLNIYDVESRKLINPRTVNAHKLRGFNGLNRISIDLKDYNLEPGRLYILVVSDFSSTYHFNFKITNDREK